MVTRIIYQILKKRKKGEATPIEPSRAREILYQLFDYADQLKRQLKWRWGNSPPLEASAYLPLVDPEIRPKEEEFIKEALTKIGGTPLAARLLYKLYKEGVLDENTASTFGLVYGWILDGYAFVHGAEHEGDVLANPEIIKQVVDGLKMAAEGKPIPVGNTYIDEIYKIDELGLTYARYVDREKLRKAAELAEKVYRAALEYLKRHPELAKAMEAAALKESRPRVITIILTKLESALEMAKWMGGVDVRALKSILYDVQDSRKIAERAFVLVKRWEEGEKDAFFEEYAHLRSVPEDRLDEYGLIGDIELIRRRVVEGKIDTQDAANLLIAIHTTYSMTESHLIEFLAKIDEHVRETHYGTRIMPEHLKEHVITPLKTRLEKVRATIKGEF